MTAMRDRGGGTVNAVSIGGRHSGAAQRNPESRAPAPRTGARAPRISASVTTLDSGFRCAVPE